LTTPKKNWAIFTYSQKGTRKITKLLKGHENKNSVENGECSTKHNETA
jgi:hypothetical protein